MSFVSWTDDLSVGHHGLDDQHKLLIELINRYHDTLERGASRAELRQAFKEIADFAIKHFRDEEATMEKHGYPQLSRHRLIHQQLLSRVGELSQDLASAVPEVERQIQFFLKSWLTAHIRGIDHQYMPYVSGAAARKTAAS